MKKPCNASRLQRQLDTKSGAESQEGAWIHDADSLATATESSSWQVSRGRFMQGSGHWPENFSFFDVACRSTWAE